MSNSLSDKVLTGAKIFFAVSAFYFALNYFSNEKGCSSSKYNLESFSFKSSEKGIGSEVSVECITIEDITDCNYLFTENPIRVNKLLRKEEGKVIFLEFARKNISLGCYDNGCNLQWKNYRIPYSAKNDFEGVCLKIDKVKNCYFLRDKINKDIYKVLTAYNGQVLALNKVDLNKKGLEKVVDK